MLDITGQRKQNLKVQNSVCIFSFKSAHKLSIIGQYKTYNNVGEPTKLVLNMPIHNCQIKQNGTSESSFTKLYAQI